MPGLEVEKVFERAGAFTRSFNQIISPDIGTFLSNSQDAQACLTAFERGSPAHFFQQPVQDQGDRRFVLEHQREPSAMRNVVFAGNSATMRDHDLTAQCQANTAAISACCKKRDEDFVHDVI